ncbi:MAG: orotate phosphoribosyltransferase [Parcubacteria group bacterium]|nr:orotate phosphoribosyltransferase [Parcubacteria group bacterium]
MTAAKGFVAYSLSQGAIEIIPGGRRLVSGRMSPYYFHSGFFNMGSSLWELGKACAAIAKDMHFDVIFGPPAKGIPIAVATAMMLHHEHGINVGHAFNREKEKDHGDEGLIVGFPLKGKRICLIDNVISTGKTFNTVADLIAKEGGVLSSAIVVFDRQERVTDEKGSASAIRAFEDAHKIPVRAAATLADLIAVLEERIPGLESPEARDLAQKGILDLILEYKAKYGA